MNRIQMASRVREQLDHFLGIFSPHFSRPGLKFVGQMIYGLQAHKDVKISQIARALDEPVSLKKTEERLGRHLKQADLARCINQQIAGHAASRIKQDTLIVIDPTDVCKTYAKKMPYLARVRDGSDGKITQGYWGCLAVACDPSRRRVIPLHQRLWSADAPDFESENEELLDVIDTIRGPSHGRGIYVMDRGGDRIKLFHPLLERRLRFIVRLRGDRDLVYGTRTMTAEQIGQGCSMHFTENTIKQGLETEKKLTLRFGLCPVRLPDRPEQLYLVVVRGFGEEPLVLLTNVAVTRSRKSLWAIVQGYLSRWLIEETIRFVKQSYRLEDIRLLDYNRLRNMMALVLAAVYFASVWLGESLKMAVMTANIKKVARRFFGVPEFHYYALADGIAILLSRHRPWKASRPARPPPDFHPELGLNLNPA